MTKPQQTLTENQNRVFWLYCCSPTMSFNCHCLSAKTGAFCSHDGRWMHSLPFAIHINYMELSSAALKKIELRRKKEQISCSFFDKWMSICQTKHSTCVNTCSELVINVYSCVISQKLNVIIHILCTVRYIMDDIKIFPFDVKQKLKQ